MVESLTAGFVMGLSAGFAPGPLLTLVIAHTLLHGTREGVRIALAPLFTDLPIIVIATLLLSRLAQSQFLLGAIALCGATYICYLGITSWRARVPEVDAAAAAPQSIMKGVLVNFLSPNPYIFWLTVGAPTLVQTWQESVWASAGFLLLFYSGLVGGKIACALITGHSRRWLTGTAYRNLMRALAVLLVVFAFRLAIDGLHRLQ